MPLSAPASREPLHSRDIRCQGFRRADGLWDIEAHLTDVKTYDYESMARGTVPAGSPIHDMWLRFTLDDDLRITAVETAFDTVPYGPCPSAGASFQGLVGLRIGPGWARKVREQVGGTHGCTHMRELINVLATVAFQTIFSLREKELLASGERRPPMIDTCLSWAADSPVVKEQYPRWYKGA
jgi:hypothetical protein